jgi:hypothetical protein
MTFQSQTIHESRATSSFLVSQIFRRISNQGRKIASLNASADKSLQALGALAPPLRNG